MKTIRVKRGMDLRLVARPTTRIDAGRQIDRVAWTPPANLIIDPEVLVKIHQKVSAGDYLLIDRNAPQIRHVAPASGEISEITYDHDNCLSQIIITLNDTAPKVFSSLKTPYSQEGIKNLMLESGLWTQLRQRPFDTTPSVDSLPDHILVTAMDSRPSAPDVRPIIAQHQLEFQAGLEALATQTAGTLWVCQPPGDELAATSIPNLKTVVFSGSHPAGTPSLHIQKLHLANTSRTIWHIDYQDVIALGFLLTYGYILSQRTVALSGNQVRDPRLITTTQGANIGELLSGELIEGADSINTTVGSYLSGQTKAWLGRFDRQITVMNDAGNHNANVKSASAAKVDGFVAEPVFEHINAFNMLPVPMLRALVSEDFELAENLGCLELMPEDLEMFDYVCPQGNHYSELLKTCNQALMERALNSSGQRQDAV